VVVERGNVLAWSINHQDLDEQWPFSNSCSKFIHFSTFNGSRIVEVASAPEEAMHVTLLAQTLSTTMFCRPCISIYACNETNLMHCLPAVYSVTILLHVSGFLVTNYQEVTMYRCDNSYVLYILVDCRRQSTKIYKTYYEELLHIYVITSWWWATRKTETCRSIVTQ
jgi:hypothetical protein